MSRLGAAIRVLRVERGLSQSALADAAGVARSYISMIESGERTNIGTETLHRLAEALDVSPVAILSTAGSVPPLDELTPEARRLAEKIDALPPGLHERAVALVDSLVQGLHAARNESTLVEVGGRTSAG